MKKLTISLIALCMACPSFANIAKENNNPTCDSTTIGATSGTTNLEAQWTANTITLDYYSGDTKVSTGSCSYDGGITLPSDPTPPTGYEFSGWQIRRAAAAPTKQCWEMNQQECEATEGCKYDSEFYGYKCRKGVSECSLINNETECDHSAPEAIDASECFWDKNKCGTEQYDDGSFEGFFD